jgi:nucleoside-diphosphate-sugar epimerase
MGYWKFINAILTGQTVTVFGDGKQVRGNTYIDDCVEATVAAAEALPGEIYNVGGGEAATVWDIVRKLEAIIGKKAEVRREPARVGDQRYTSADTSKLQRHLGWQPRVGLDEGLARQMEWQKKHA